MFTYKDPQRVAGRSPAFEPAPGGLLSLPAWGWLWACFLSSISHIEASRLGQAGRTRPDLGCQHDTMRGPEQASLWTSLVPAMAGPLVSSGPTGSPAQTGSPAGPRPFRLRFSPGEDLERSSSLCTTSGDCSNRSVASSLPSSPFMKSHTPASNASSLDQSHGGPDCCATLPTTLSPVSGAKT